MKRADLFAVEIWHGISSTLGSRVDAISDDMLVEFAVSCLYEGHGAPMRHAPKCRTNYGANQVSRTHAAQGCTPEKEDWINTHYRLSCVQFHGAKVRCAAR